MQLKMLFSLALLVGLSSIANAALITQTYSEYDTSSVLTGNTLTFEYDDVTGGVSPGSVVINTTTIGTSFPAAIVTDGSAGNFTFLYSDTFNSPSNFFETSAGVITGTPDGDFAVFTTGNTFAPAAVPEPSALGGLFLASLVGLGRRRRR